MMNKEEIAKKTDEIIKERLKGKAEVIFKNPDNGQFIQFDCEIVKDDLVMELNKKKSIAKDRGLYEFMADMFKDGLLDRGCYIDEDYKG